MRPWSLARLVVPPRYRDSASAGNFGRQFFNEADVTTQAQARQGRSESNRNRQSVISRSLVFGSLRSLPSLPPLLSPNVYSRSFFGVLLSLSQHFVSNRRSIAFAESDVLEKVGKRIAFAPSEVNVRYLPGQVTKIKEKGSDCVGHCWCSRA